MTRQTLFNVPVLRIFMCELQNCWCHLGYGPDGANCPAPGVTKSRTDVWDTEQVCLPGAVR